MPQYQYEAKKGPGDPVKGVVEAENQRAAAARLRDMGYFPIRVEEYKEPVKNEAFEQLKNIKLFHSRVGLKDRNIFYRQLANLIESGMPIVRSLKTLAEQTENPKMSAVITQLREDVQQGNSFAEAMEKQPDVFSAMSSSLVRAGETGGMLEEVLWRIVAFGEQEEELRGKVISAMVYPIFLLIVGSTAIFILISFVFPKFIAIFEDFNAELPMPTLVVMAVCEFMGTWWWAVLIGLGFLIAAIRRHLKTEKGTRQRDKFYLLVPVVKSLVQKYEMAKFARTLGTLLDNGVPILNALKITAETMSNIIIADEVATIQNGVREGQSISESMQKTQWFPPLVVSMFMVGEESGRIGAVTARVADAYDIEVDRAVKTLTSLFEPLLIVIMGVIVGFLVIAMLLPMLSLSSVIG